MWFCFTTLFLFSPVAMCEKIIKIKITQLRTFQRSCKALSAFHEKTLGIWWDTVMGSSINTLNVYKVGRFGWPLSPWVEWLCLPHDYEHITEKWQTPVDKFDAFRHRNEGLQGNQEAIVEYSSASSGKICVEMKCIHPFSNSIANLGSECYITVKNINYDKRQEAILCLLAKMWIHMLP